MTNWKGARGNRIKNWRTQSPVSSGTGVTLQCGKGKSGWARTLGCGSLVSDRWCLANIKSKQKQKLLRTHEAHQSVELGNLTLASRWVLSSLISVAVLNSGKKQAWGERGYFSLSLSLWGNQGRNFKRTAHPQSRAGERMNVCLLSPIYPSLNSGECPA